MRVGLADVHHQRVHALEAEHCGVITDGVREHLQKLYLQRIKGVAVVGLEKTERQLLPSDLQGNHLLPSSFAASCLFKYESWLKFIEHALYSRYCGLDTTL